MYDSGIIGHQKIVDFLKQSIESHKIGQALLFIGPDGVGKTTVAQWLINRFFNKNNNPAESVRIINKVHPDIFFTDDDQSSLKIEQVRKILDFAYQTPSLGNKKIIIINKAERLTESGMNALLKTLEEPPISTLFILTTSQPEQILSTVKSRCLNIYFKPLPINDIYQFLSDKGIDNNEAKMIALISSGLPGIALNWLKSPEYISKIIEQAKELLKQINTDKHSQFQFSSHQITGKIFNDKKEEVLNLLKIWQVIFRDILLNKTDCPEYIRYQPAIKMIINSSDRLTHLSIINTLKSLLNKTGYLNKNVQPTLVLNNLLLHYAYK
ncbi:MAG: AAA family ATPase [bacterium]